MNSDMVRLRKYQDDLNVSGTGAVLMGAWSVVRGFIELFMGSKDRLELDADDPSEMLIGIIAAFIIISITCIIVMKVHLYIGLNAIRASKGMPYKKGYLKATIIFLVVSVASLAAYWEDLQDIKNLDTTIASILVDLTSIYIFIVVIVSSLKIKELEDRSDQE